MNLRALPSAFVYRYDFGDDWEHDVEVLGAGADRPGCVDGEGGCPPEDCGGPGGYADLLAVLADPDDEEHEHMRQWAGELPTFDRAATDLLVRQTVGEVPASVRLVLDLLDGGVKLTPAGRLPRRIVRQVQEQRPGWYPLGRPASLEEDLFPLAVLHELLRRVGLLRLAKGVLRPTRAAADDLQTIRRLRSWFEPDGFLDILTGVTIATLEASGPLPTDELAGTVYPLLGGRWSGQRRQQAQQREQLDHRLQPVGEVDARRAVSCVRCGRCASHQHSTNRPSRTRRMYLPATGHQAVAGWAAGSPAGRHEIALRRSCRA